MPGRPSKSAVFRVRIWVTPCDSITAARRASCACTRSPVEFTTIERVERDHRSRGQRRDHAVELRDSLMRRGRRWTRQKDYLGFACRKIVGKANDDLVIFADGHGRLVSMHVHSLPEAAAVHTPAPPWDSESRGAVEVWVAVTVTVAGAGAVTEAVAVVGPVDPGPVGLGRGGIRDGSGAAGQGSHTRNRCCP